MLSMDVGLAKCIFKVKWSAILKKLESTDLQHFMAIGYITLRIKI